MHQGNAMCDCSMARLCPECCSRGQGTTTKSDYSYRCGTVHTVWMAYRDIK